MNNGNEERLQGNMGTGALVMAVLAFTGPLGVASGFIPVVLADGGLGGIWIYIFGIIMFGFFAVGFSRMGMVMPKAGGFYAYITEGLGKDVGFVAAALAAVGYPLIMIYGPPFLAILAGNVVVDSFNGPDIPWVVYAVGALVISTFLAYRRIDLSAKVLFFVMIFECLAVLVFDIIAFTKGFKTPYAESGGMMFGLPELTNGTYGVALLLGLGNFFGFEATVIYREECKDPLKTIPRATFISVFLIGGIYALTTWGYIAFYGADHVVAQAQAETASLFVNSLRGITGSIVVDIISVTAVVSVFASQLSIQNVGTRYWYSLAVDGAVPKVFGHVNKKHHSPDYAALIVGVFGIIMCIIFYLTGKPADYVYPLFSGAGTFMVTVVIFLAGCAVWAYFKKDSHGFGPMVTKIAPILALVGLAFMMYMSIANFGALIGSTGTLTVIFFAAIMAFMIASYAYVKWLKKNKPEVYERLGRKDSESAGL